MHREGEERGKRIERKRERGIEKTGRGVDGPETRPPKNTPHDQPPRRFAVTANAGAARKKGLSFSPPSFLLLLYLLFCDPRATVPLVLSVIARPGRSFSRRPRERISSAARERRQSDLYSNESRWKSRFIDAPIEPSRTARGSRIRSRGRKIQGLSSSEERKDAVPRNRSWRTGTTELSLLAGYLLFLSFCFDEAVDYVAATSSSGRSPFSFHPYDF